MRLAVRCVPQPDVESLRGFGVRVARANGYAKLAWLSQAARLPKTYASLRCELAHLAELTAIPVETLEAMAIWPVHGSAGLVRFGRHQVRRAALDSSHLRVCPSCLSGTFLFPRVWEMVAAVACPSHGTMLVDTCPSCCRRLRFADGLAGWCPCGFKLAALIPRPAPPALLALSELLYRLNEGSTPSPGQAPVSSLPGALDFMRSVATTETSRDWRGAVLTKPTIAELQPCLERAGPTLLEWPSGLHAWLSRCRKDGAGHVGLDAELGLWSARLAKLLGVAGLAQVGAEVRSWIADNLGGRKQLRRSVFFPDGHLEQRLPAREAARRLRVSSVTLSRMVSEGTVAADVSRMASRRNRMVHAGEVERLQAAAASTLDTGQAAARLGVTVSQVEQLRTAGIVDARKQAFEGKCCFRIEASSLTLLDERLRSGAEPAPRRTEGLVPLIDIPRRRQVSLTSVLSRLLGGTVPYYSLHDGEAHASILSRYSVRVSDLFADASAALSVKEAAALLGIAVRMVPVLVTTGCIRATGRGQDGRSSRRGLRADDIARFATEYVLSRTLARLASTPSTGTVIRRLRACGIEPVVQPDTRAGISAVWRLADVCSSGFLNTAGTDVG